MNNITARLKLENKNPTSEIWGDFVSSFDNEDPKFSEDMNKIYRFGRKFFIHHSKLTDNDEVAEILEKYLNKKVKSNIDSPHSIKKDVIEMSVETLLDIFSKE